MGDWAQVFIQIDKLDGATRSRMADDLSRWMLDRGIIAPFDTSKAGWREEFGRTDWSPGPAWRDVVDEVPGAVFESLWHNGVDVNVAVDYQSAYGNYEPWRCPQCDSELDETDYATSWVETHVEPVAPCATCGWSALLGDWPGNYPAVLVGAPAVIFHNWHPLKPAFADELTTRLGNGRCRQFTRKD